MLVIGKKPVPEQHGNYGLKHYAVHFRFRGHDKMLRLIGWSDESVMKEFCDRFPEAQPKRVEYLGDI